MQIKDRASHTGYTFYGCVPLAKLKSSYLYFWEDTSVMIVKPVLLLQLFSRCFVVVGWA